VTLRRTQWVPRSLEATFAFFARPQNLPSITPPWLGFRIVTPEPIVMAHGLVLDCSVRVMGVRTHWRSRIEDYDPPHAFRDVQVNGPYRLWEHRHEFRDENGGTRIEDKVVYVVPLGPLGVLLDRVVIRRQLRAIFDYRSLGIAARLGAPPRRSPAEDALP
jgi:ligand-binding SRPBCC domain-containing protein